MELLLLWETIVRWKKVFLSVFLGFFLFVVITTLLMQSVYKAKAVLIINDSNPTSALFSTLQIRSEVRRSAMEDPFGADLAMITAQPILDSVIHDYELKSFFGSALEYDDFTEKKILRMLLPQPYVEAELADDTDQLVNVVALAPDPQLAAEIANNVANAAIIFRNNLMRREFAKIRESLSSRINDVGDTYYKALIASRDFHMKEGAESVEISEQSKSLINKIRNIESEIISNENSAADMEAQNNASEALLKEISEFRQASMDYRPSEERTSYESILAEKLVSIIGQSAELTKAHPAMQALEKQIAEIKRQLKNQPQTSIYTIRKSIDPVYDSLKDRIQQNTVEIQGNKGKQKVLISQLNEAKLQLLRLPQLTVSDDRLTTEISAARDLYQTLRQYLMKVTLAESVAVSELQIVETATVPTSRDFPSKKINFSLGLIVAFFLALMSVLLLEYIARAKTAREREAS